MQPNWLRPRPGPSSAHVRPFGNDGDSCHCSYYINYLTKAMQLEDPRGGGRNYKQLQNERCSTESIALQVSRIEAMQLDLIGKLTECVSLAAFTAQFTSQFPLPRGASEQQFDGRARFPGAGETAACTAQSVDQPTAVGLVTWTIGKLQQPCTLAWFHPPLSLALPHRKCPRRCLSSAPVWPRTCRVAPPFRRPRSRSKSIRMLWLPRYRTCSPLPMRITYVCCSNGKQESLEADTSARYFR